MARSIKIWTCKYCDETFEKVNTGHAYEFCTRRHAGLYNQNPKLAIIPDGQPMSRSTQFRRKSQAGLTQPVFRYPFNESFFDTWSNDLAWLLGLIWSDGCLQSNSINICSKDYDLMETVANLIEMKDGIRPKNKGAAWYILFTSKRVASFMRGLGLTENKSLTANWPVIPTQYQADFVRGLIDGDGSVHERKLRPGQQAIDIYVQIVGAAPDIREGLCNWFTSQGINYTAGISHGRVWKVTVHPQKSLRHLYSLLYPAPNVPALHRKRIRFDRWMATPRVRSGRPKKQAVQP